MIACCGYWDNSIRCYSAEEGRLLQSVRVHKDIVTCIELGSDGRTLASGAHPSLSCLPVLCMNLGACPPEKHLLICAVRSACFTAAELAVLDRAQHT